LECWINGERDKTTPLRLDCLPQRGLMKKAQASPNCDLQPNKNKTTKSPTALFQKVWV
jgi:hypothetical protein